MLLKHLLLNSCKMSYKDHTFFTEIFFFMKVLPLFPERYGHL